MDPIMYWLWLATRRGLGPRALERLLSAVGSPEALWRLAPGEVPAVDGIRQSDLRACEDKSFTAAEKILADCAYEGISILTMGDPRYPQRLREIETAPTVLYYRGELLPFDRLPVVAVVGSRNASRPGLQAAARMGWELASCGGTVVSGAAKGVDSYALEGALEAGKQVAAVLGNGLDIVYPPQAKKLYHAIADQGCLISEYPPGTKPFAGNFPRRNRIMSGLSEALLVVEAAKKSGTLITVDFALEQGRDVYAMPGSVGLDSCEGSNALLRDGASIALSGWDILQNYSYQYPELLHCHTQRLSSEQLSKIEARETPSSEGARPVKAVKKNTEKTTEKRISSSKIDGEVCEKTDAEEKNLIDNGKNTNYIDLQQLTSKLNPEERAIVLSIGTELRHVDDIIAGTALPPAKVLALLTLLEVRGIVGQKPGKLFYLKS